MDVAESDVLTRIELTGERTLIVKRSDGSDALILHESDGRMAVSIVITADAVTLTLGGANLAIDVERGLSITAQSLVLQGRESVAISTEGPLTTHARSQTITSTHGDVEVQANDDVKLTGERIRLNC